MKRQFVPLFIAALTLMSPLLLADEPLPDPNSASGQVNSTDTATSTDSEANPPVKDPPYEPYKKSCSSCESDEIFRWQADDSDLCTDEFAAPSSVLLHYSLGTVSYNIDGSSSSAYDYGITDMGPPRKGPGINQPMPMPMSVPPPPQDKWGRKIRRMAYVEAYSDSVNPLAASYETWSRSGSLGNGTEAQDAQGKQYASNEYVTNLTGGNTSTQFFSFHRNTCGNFNGVTKRFDTTNAHLAKSATVVFTAPNILTYHIKYYGYDQNVPQTYGPKSINAPTTVIKEHIFTYVQQGSVWTLTFAKGNNGNIVPVARITYSKSSSGNIVTYNCQVERAYPSATSGVLTLGVVRNFIVDFLNLGPELQRITRYVNHPGTTEELTTHYSYTQIGGEDAKTLAETLGPESLRNKNYSNVGPHKKTMGLRLQSIERSDGFWQLFTYDDNTATRIYNVTTYQVWKNLPISQYKQARKISFTAIGDTLQYIESIEGKTVSTTTAQMTKIGSLVTIRSQKSTDATSSPITEEYGYQTNGNLSYIRHIDGTLTRYTHSTVDGYPVTTEENGVIDASQSAVTATGSIVGTFTQGTRTSVTENFFEYPISTATFDIASNLPLAREDVVTTDAMGRPNKTIYNLDLNDYQQITYHCCGIESVRQRDGSLTSYNRDATGAITSTATVLGSRITTNITQREIKVLDGKATIWKKQTRTVTAAGNTATEFLGETYTNLAGQTIRSLTPDHNGDGQPEETTYAYNLNARTSSVTRPDGTTSTSTYYADGKPHTSITSANGVAITPLTTNTYTLHNLNGGGIKTTVTEKAGSVTLKTVHSYADQADRTIKTESPGYNGAILTSTPIYDERGRTIGQTRTGKPAVKAIRNLLGETIETWIDANGDGEFNDTIVGGIADTCQKSLTDFVTEDGRVCQRRRTWIRNDGNTDVLTATRFSSTDGLYSKSIPLAGTGPITTSTALKPYVAAASGLLAQSSTRTYLTTTTFLESLSTTALNADGTITSTQVNKDTLGATITSASSTSDLLDRTTSQTGERGLTTTFSNFTAAGTPLLTTQSDGTKTRNTINPLGQTTKVETLNATDAVKATRHTSYHVNGQVAGEWGDLTYPTYKLYNIQGQLEELRTYKNQSGEPTAATTGYEKTTWNYEPSTGLLLNKRYADLKGPDYTYYPDGKLHVAEAARNLANSTERLKKTYSYTLSGQLTTIDYSDTTPDVAITYNRLGQTLSTSNTISTSVYDYDPDTYALDKETITQNIPGQPAFTRIIDRSQDPLGRSTGFQLKTPALLTDHSTLYTYSPTNSRLGTVSVGTLEAPSQTFVYGYEPNSNLIKTTQSFTNYNYTANTGTAIHQVTNTYEPNRNVLLTKTNQRASDNATISSVTYEVNSIGQRKKRTTTDATASSVITDWNYDTLGQVTSEDKTGTDTDRAFEYDTIGNRKKSADSLTLPPTDNYTSNPLNQYTQISVSSASSVVPSYDNDGNQINAQIKSGASFQLASYTWDAQNRLIEVKDLNNNSLVKHHYDSYSRKIATITSPLPLGEGQGAGAQLTTLYIYNGWSSIAEYRLHNSSFTLHTSLTWGPDLSGSEQGAGGVGGLLCLQEFPLPVGEGQGEGQSYYPCYDGNGNITEYLDSTGNIVAHYGYDAFGNTTVATGTKANDFNYRFSTKPIDSGTGLYYYGYRWYDPLTGRWPSRDPIEESGGVNLYGFLSNAGVYKSDYLGLLDDTSILLRQWKRDQEQAKCQHDQPLDGGYSMDWNASTTGDPTDIDESGHFFNIVGGAKNPYSKHGTTGAQLFEALESMSGCCNCIRNFRIATHGGSGRGQRADGINSPLPGKDAGFHGATYPWLTLPYVEYNWDFPFRHNRPGIPNPRYHDDSRNLIDLNASVRMNRSIVFCKECTISIMSCRVSDDFGQQLSRITGCKVVWNNVGCTAKQLGKPWGSSSYRPDDFKIPENSRGFMQSIAGSVPAFLDDNYTPP